MPYLPTDFHILRIFIVNIVNILVFEAKILVDIQINKLKP